MLGAEFQLGDDPDANGVMFYLALPFGFAGPPGIFGRLMEGVQR